MNKEKKTNKYSKEILIPAKIAGDYMEYCRLTKMKYSEPLRVLILESILQLHNTSDLNLIVEKTRNWEAYDKELVKFHVRLPDEVMAEIHSYCKFFQLNRLRCHFLYYLIEKKLTESLEGVLRNG